MAAKGTVSMEELRQQLGDHLPGAMNIAAKSMGMTTGEFMKAVAAGKILAGDLLPKMADELHNLYGVAAETAALESGQAAVNRLSLSARACARVLRMARTIADLDDAAAIGTRHLAEAVSLRVLDRG